MSFFGLFGKKKEGEEEKKEGEETGESGEGEEESEEGDDSGDDKKEETGGDAGAGGGADAASLSKLSVQVEKISASVESFGEVRKSFGERFNRISEQIGELRSMILERDKTIQTVEIKAVKAHDLVATVQPEKLMTQIQKSDAKIEALKANLEGNESIMQRLMEEIKEAKRKIDFFRGVEEVVKMAEETKKDLLEIKKVQSKVALEVDKVDTMYGEMKKKFQVVDVVDTGLQEIKAQVEQNVHDVQFLKEKITDLASKEDLNKLVEKIKSYADALGELEKSSSFGKDIDRLKEIMKELK